MPEEQETGSESMVPSDAEHPRRASDPEVLGHAADESTPLLRSTNENSSTVKLGTGRNNQPSRASFSSLFRRRPVDSSISSAIDDEAFYSEELVRQRSRLNSYPVLPEPEITQKDDAAQDGAAHVEEAAGQATADPVVETDTATHSKYMRVSSGRFWLVFTTVLLGYFVACFDTTLMASSHPVITSAFNASNVASWLTTAFMITNTGFQPMYGRLSDTIGRRPVYMLALTIFGLTNLWCALSNSIESFIVARAICGIGAGGTMSMGLVVTNDLVRIEHRGTFISHINVAAGLGSACGAAFGGAICDSIGWRWAFGIQVPIIAVCGAAGFFFIPSKLGPMLISKNKDKDGSSPAWRALRNFDSLGIATLVSAVAFLVLFFNMGGNMYPWDHPVIITYLVLGVLLSAMVIWVEKRAKQPIMPLHLLVTPPFMNLTYANFLAGIASNTVLFNAPLWFQAVELNTPSASGLRLAAPAIGCSVAGVSTGYVMTYTKRLKPMLVLGGIVYLAGSIALVFIDQGMSEAAKVALITPAPLSQGFIYPGSMMAAFASSSQDDQGVVTTTLSLWRNLGIVVGVAISSLVFQNVLATKLQENVTGPEAQRYIAIAWASVRRIKDMPLAYRSQVIQSYAEALRMSFVTAIVASGILLLLMIPIRLPRLKAGSSMNVAGGE